MLIDFQNFFTTRLTSTFATNSCLNIPQRFEHVATLACEIWMSENYRQYEKCIAINDKPQGSITKHLTCHVLL